MKERYYIRCDNGRWLSPRGMLETPDFPYRSLDDALKVISADRVRKAFLPPYRQVGYSLIPERDLSFWLGNNTQDRASSN